MSAQAIVETASALIADDKGLLAMDESDGTCNKRFAGAGIPETEAARRAYRELIVTTPGLGECISGAILHDETIRQQKEDGTPLVKILTDAGIIPGIKVDTGAMVLAGHPGEKITEGLDGLRGRLEEYSQMGARFAKWRAVIAAVEPDLAEWDYGDYEGKGSAEIRKGRPDWNIWRDGCPGGETPAEVSNRADRLIAHLCALDGNIALFSHGQFGCALAARWIELSLIEGQHFAIGPASISILGREPGHSEVPVIALWNAARPSLRGSL